MVDKLHSQSGGCEVHALSYPPQEFHSGVRKTHLHRGIDTRMHKYTQACACRGQCAAVHKQVHRYLCTQMHVQVHTCMGTQVIMNMSANQHTYTCACMHIHTHVQIPCVCTHKCAHLHTYKHAHLHSAHISTYTQRQIHTETHICMCERSPGDSGEDLK